MSQRRISLATHVLSFTASLFLCLQCMAAVTSQDSPAADAQSRGKINPKVVSSSDSTQSYAVYLPSNYDRGRKWPILYVFDPAARGQLAVETFRDAAEKYGYIVAGSNNYRNGPWVEIFPVIRALWIDTHARYSLDEGRAYTAGFSGGARAAIMMARSLSGKVAGVIACGAGFPLEPGQGPGKNTQFLFFGIVGMRDFNFREMRDLDAKLAELGLTHRLAVFDGPHGIRLTQQSVITSGRPPRRWSKASSGWRSKA